MKISLLVPSRERLNLKLTLISSIITTVNNIDNVEFIKQDFFDYTPNELFDTIICQSFITHVPNYVDAIDRMTKMLTPNGTLIIGVYNNYGKILKKIININYKNSRLEQDQERNPYEVSFSHKEMMNLFQDL